MEMAGIYGYFEGNMKVTVRKTLVLCFNNK